MNYNTLKTTPSRTHFIHSTSDTPRSHSHNTAPNPSHFETKRNKTKLDTEDYKRSLRRSYTRAKQLAFFNPDLTHFITLTYKDNQLDHTTTLHHIKQFIKYQNNKIKSINNANATRSHNTTKPTRNEFKKNKHQETKQTAPIPPLKYLYVFERQKRGAIHVHMIANGSLRTETNKNGYESVKYWKHGFTSILRIDQTDSQFKPYLYLFKYMHKSERIGDSFIHISRNVFDPIETVDPRDYLDQLKDADSLYTEDLEYFLNDQLHKIRNNYLSIKKAQR